MSNYVYHYTDLNALKGIVSLHPKKLTFWGSRYDCMNDPQDYLFALQVVLPKILNSIEKRKDILYEEKEDNPTYPYIVSFTENEDDDFMWKHYKAEVCLEIDTESFTPWLTDGKIIKAFWGKCKYASEKALDDAFFQSWQDSLQYIDNIPSMARHACVYIKRDAFKPEKEWRLYMADELMPYVREHVETCNAERPQDVKVKCVRNGDIILYKEFQIEANALKRIIINDTDWAHFQKVKKHAELLLAINGFFPNDVQIEQTKRYPIEV